MKPLTAVVVGLGKRGRIHLYGLCQNKEMFQVVGICDRNFENLKTAGKEHRIAEEFWYSDAEEMLRKTRPDVMAFVTMPDIRLSLVELAVKYGVKGLMFEKPMANSLEEARKIRDLCTEHHIKTIVCQQHKYLRSFRQLKKVLDEGEIGGIYKIEANCQSQASQIGTHYIDYILWAAGNTKALSVVGHVHGNYYLNDGHPSPDYILGQIALKNGIRGTIECGYFSRQHAEHDVGFHNGPKPQTYWTDDRLTVYGTKGYAWAMCNGKYGCFSVKTAPGVRKGDYHDFAEYEQYDAQVLYTKDFADWMNGKKVDHPCNISRTYHGFEILEAIYLSAIRRTRVDLPFEELPARDTLSVLREKLSPVEHRKYQIWRDEDE